MPPHSCSLRIDTEQSLYVCRSASELRISVCCVVLQIVQGVRTLFRSGRTLPAEWRIQQLNAILSLIDEQCDELTAAMQQDLNKVTVPALNV